MSDDKPHYEFASAKTSAGALALFITPVIGRRRLHTRSYVLLPDEVRALIACLDILPDPDPVPE
ncbi:hypothetical protein BLEM_0594 [Bifidobacterium lemurum]|uniref:Uncharacterized protein n=1 Tax=Bifidobacterium lemurum TaxID=1603886 RepID=A0A261FU28_9BIFI|nr:hypothetical protein [Bifidobacterium lemurum]OZG62677.1 hypothetical protein BLEM_0594 [Bifidobacterium lemurum]QOL34606.1 hypothetical protein BL8807_01330 [Bifidobacterium lemurum]